MRFERKGIAIPSILLLACVFSSVRGAEVAGYVFDETGAVRESADAAGRKTRYDYQDGRLVRTTFPDGSKIERVYDAFGRCTTVADALGVAEYRYDTLSHLARATQPNKLWVEFAYDHFGHVVSLSVPENAAGGGSIKFEYAYDFLGRLTSIKTPSGEFVWAFDPAKATVTRTMPNGIVSTFVKGPSGQTQSIRHVGKDGKTLLAFEYTYLPGGRLGTEKTTYADGTRTVTYKYDQAGRVVHTESSDGASSDYTYDLLGNLTARVMADGRGGKKRVEFAADKNDGLVRAGDAVCASDACGNLFERGAGEGKISYAYDFRSGLTNVTRGANAIRYAYDGDGTLARRQSGAETLEYLALPFASDYRILAEYPPAGSPGVYVLSEFPLARLSGDASEYYLEDRANSVRGIADATGKVTNLTYGAYGECDLPKEIANLPRYLFAGMYYDPVAKLYLANARAYDPELARFLQPDPLQYSPKFSQLGMSAFAYCGGDPVNKVDRAGMDPVWMDVFRDNVQYVFREFAKGMGELYDPDTANKWYAMQSSLASQHGDKIGEQTWNMLGGFTTGKAANPGQAYWKYAWDSVPVISISRSFFSSLRYSAKGDYADASVEIFGMLGTPLEENASKIRAVFNAAKDISPEKVADGLRIAAIFDKASVGHKFVDYVHNSFEFDESLSKFRNDSPSSSSKTLNINRPSAYFSPTIRGTVSDYRSDRRDAVSYFDNHTSSSVIETSRTHESYRTTFNGADENRRIQLALAREAHPTSTDVRPSVPLSVDDYKPKMKPTTSFPPSPPPPPPPMISSGFGGGRSGGGGASGSWGGPPPSVGGIFLGGAGNAVAGLEDLCGISADPSNGRVVLLSKKAGKDVALPPIELGDLAVILRSVYLQGQPPYFSLDPEDPNEPNGARLMSRYSPGIENTRVGWILFQADRLMKCYGQGKDNETQTVIGCKIAGYQSMLLEPLELPVKAEPTWHRFWLEPLPTTSRNVSGTALFENPKIYVKIQQMKAEGKKLVPAGWPDSDPSAKPFRDWFTHNYDAIGGEDYTKLRDPVHLEKKVAVFAELRRVAGLVAVAEKLKEHNVELPFWLLNYKPEAWPTPKSTPAMTVVFENDTRKVSLHGGVNLSPHFVPADAKAPPPPPKIDRIPAALAKEAPVPVRPAAVKIDVGGADYTAVTLPGASSGAMAPFTQTVADLEVPLKDGSALRLARSYSSFANDATPFGYGWRFEMPKLFVTRSIDRLNNGRLFDALGRQLATFTPPERHVPGVALVANGAKLISLETKGASSAAYRVMHDDDRVQDFAQSGELLQQIDAQGHVLEFKYKRLETGELRLTGVEAAFGRERAAIALEYDEKGRVVAAVAGEKSKTTYRYDDTGHLAEVQSGGGSLGYVWDKAGFISETRQNGQFLARIAYNERGQIVSMEHGEGDEKASLKIEHGDDGTCDATAKMGDAGWIKSTYDSAMRETAASDSDGNELKRTFRADGRLEKIDGKTATGARVETVFAGDSVSVAINGKPALRATRDAARGTTSVECENQVRTTTVDPEGNLVSKAIAPAGKLGDAVKVEYEKGARVRSVTVGGAQLLKASFDKAGQPTKLVTPQTSLDIAWQKNGRPASFKTSDGCACDVIYDREVPDVVKKVIVTDRGSQSMTKYEEGMPAIIQNFDGGSTVLTYGPAGEEKSKRLKTIARPAQPKLEYAYDAKGNLESVTVEGVRTIKWVRDGLRVSVLQTPF